MNENEFEENLAALSKDSQKVEARPGDPGPAPVTKLGGEPWWPKGTTRPICRRAGHPMAFIAQIRLSDVPGCEQLTSHLYSFHYCHECTLAGDMSFGWASHDQTSQPIPFPSMIQRLLNRLGISPIPTIPSWQDSQSYDTRIFSHVDEVAADELGAIADSPLTPQTLQTLRVSEVPTPDDYPENVRDPRDPMDSSNQSSDDHEIGELVHLNSSKLGGWPSWVQDSQWPSGVNGAPMQFIAQLDSNIAEDSSWGGGGYAYLFADLSSEERLWAQLVIQTT